MHFLFLGVFQKQLEVFQNKTFAPRGRLKAFQSMIDELEKTKADSQEKVKEIFKKEAVMLFDVCYKSLKSYDEYPPLAPLASPGKHKPEAKIIIEIEDILALLQRLFNDFPAEKITEIQFDDFCKIVVGLLRHNCQDKYKTYGFFLLTSYTNLLKQIDALIPEVFLLIINNSIFIIYLNDVFHIMKSKKKG